MNALKEQKLSINTRCKRRQNALERTPHHGKKKKGRCAAICVLLLHEYNPAPPTVTAHRPASPPRDVVRDQCAGDFHAGGRSGEHKPAVVGRFARVLSSVHGNVALLGSV